MTAGYWFRAFPVLLLAWCLGGCEKEEGDRPFASGEGSGREYSMPGSGRARYVVENCFTRDVILVLEARGLHYELAVPPVRNRFIVVPDYQYRVSIKSKCSTVTQGQYELVPAPDGKLRGYLVRLRP